MPKPLWTIRCHVTEHDWQRVKRDPSHPGWDKIRDFFRQSFDCLEIQQVKVRHVRTDAVIEVTGTKSANPLQQFWVESVIHALNPKACDCPARLN